MPNIVKRMYEKREFLVLVFSNLLAQLGITYYVMNKTNNPDISIMPLFVAQILIILLIAFVPMPEFMKFMLFGLGHAAQRDQEDARRPVPKALKPLHKTAAPSNCRVPASASISASRPTGRVNLRLICPIMFCPLVDTSEA